MKIRIALVSASIALAACGDEFLPASYLDGPRVLAVAAEPPEIGPGETAVVRATTFVPAERTIATTNWSFCPLTTGARGGFACVAPVCETALEPAADGSVSVNATALAGACLQKLAAGAQAPGGGAGGIETVGAIETVVRYDLALDDGTVLSSVVRIPFHPATPPAQRNRAPVFAQVSALGRALQAGPVDASVVEGESVDLVAELDPASLDTWTDDSGRTTTENPVISWFATAGRFDADRTNGASSTMRWTASPLDDAAEVRFYAVARDLRGGQAVAGPFVVPLAR